MPKATGVPVARTTDFVNRPPRIKQSNVKSCRIQHREFIDNFNGPAAGPAFSSSLAGYAINPGVDETFSWLSNIAVNWERYKFHRLKFSYKTRLPSSSAGSIMMAPDYDSADGPPVDELTLLSYGQAKDCSVWKDLEIVCDPKGLAGGRNDHFVRSGQLAPNLDVKTYDCGNFWIATDVVSGTSFGKLFVEYDVEFFNPQLPYSGDPLIGTSQFNGGGTMTAAKPFGTAPVTNVLSNVGTMLGTATNNTVPVDQDIATALLTTNFVGTGISTASAPTVTDKFGNPTSAVVSAVNAFMANAGLTQAYANWGIKPLRKGDILSIGALTATTVTVANSVLSSLVTGIV